MVEMKDHIGLVHHITKQYATPGTQMYTDMLEAGTIGLQRAIEKFDESKGFKFSTYATNWIRAKVLKILQSAIRSPIKVSIDKEDYDQIDEKALDVAEAATIKIEVTEVLKDMNERDHDIFKMRYGLEPYTRSHTLREIGYKYKVTGQYISALEQRAMTKLKQNNVETIEKEKEVIDMTGHTFIPISKLEAGEYVVVNPHEGTFQRIRDQVLKTIKPGDAMRVAELIKLIPELFEKKGAARYNYLHNAVKPLPNVVFIKQGKTSFIGVKEPKETPIK